MRITDLLYVNKPAPRMRDAICYFFYSISQFGLCGLRCAVERWGEVRWAGRLDVVV